MGVLALSAVTVIVAAYTVGCAARFGIPESFSRTYYDLGDDGWVFQLFMFGVAMGLLPLWLAVCGEGLQCLVFLACSSLMFVAAAPEFRVELQGRVHYTAAAVCCVSVFAWQILDGMWDVVLWFVWMGGMLTLKDRSKWCWWLECAAVGSLLTNLWRMV